MSDSNTCTSFSQKQPQNDAFEQRLMRFKAEIAKRSNHAPKNQQTSFTGLLWVKWITKNLLMDEGAQS